MSTCFSIQDQYVLLHVAVLDYYKTRQSQSPKFNPENADQKLLHKQAETEFKVTIKCLPVTAYRRTNLYKENYC